MNMIFGIVQNHQKLDLWPKILSQHVCGIWSHNLRVEYESKTLSIIFGQTYWDNFGSLQQKRNQNFEKLKEDEKHSDFEKFICPTNM